MKLCIGFFYIVGKHLNVPCIRAVAKDEGIVNFLPCLFQHPLHNGQIAILLKFAFSL